MAEQLIAGNGFLQAFYTQFQNGRCWGWGRFNQGFMEIQHKKDVFPGKDGLIWDVELEIILKDGCTSVISRHV